MHFNYCLLIMNQTQMSLPFHSSQTSQHSLCVMTVVDQCLNCRLGENLIVNTFRLVVLVCALQFTFNHVPTFGRTRLKG